MRLLFSLLLKNSIVERCDFCSVSVYKGKPIKRLFSRIYGASTKTTIEPFLAVVLSFHW